VGKVGHQSEKLSIHDRGLFYLISFLAETHFSHPACFFFRFSPTQLAPVTHFLIPLSLPSEKREGGMGRGMGERDGDTGTILILETRGQDKEKDKRRGVTSMNG
jgi:hypothetical protein